MTLETLLALDLGRYLGLAQCIAGPRTAAWFEDANGDVVAGDPFAADGQYAKAGFAIVNHLKQPIAHWRVACPSKRTLVEAREGLALVFSSLCEELRLSYDLDSLTDELTHRYEDLNLVFDNQEVATGLIDLQTALSKLVENAFSHLPAGMVMLLFPEYDIEYALSQNLEDDCDLDGMKSLARGGLWSYMRRQQQPLVLNADGADQELQFTSTYGVKVLLAPVRSTAEASLGYLLLAKPAATDNFSNSDRRLAEVICQNALSLLAAHYDALTGLLQRSAFESELTLCQSGNQTGQQHALIYLSIDRTSVVNDAFGRATGDLLIKNVGQVLARSVRRSDVLSRLAGDEFAILLRDTRVADAERIAQSIEEAARSISLGIAEGEPTVSVSMGICAIDSADSADESLSRAQIACDKAREGGGGKTHVFDNENKLMAARNAQSQMVTQLQSALANDHFDLYCQPIVPLAPNHHGRHFEVLLRMRDGLGGIVPPNDFLPVAERYSLLPQIDRWVVRQTLAALGSSSYLVVAADAVCAINLSGQSLSDPQFLDFVLEALAESDVSPSNICFEITETAAINDLGLAQLFITELRSLGFQFSLDDFGTGLSSFTYLQQMPVDYLKIDGSFVSKITTDPVSRAMVKAIADVAEAMDVRTVGEFVEDEAIRDALRELGITYGQGYLFSKPLPLAEYFAAILDDESVGLQA